MIGGIKKALMHSISCPRVAPGVPSFSQSYGLEWAASLVFSGNKATVAPTGVSIKAATSLEELHFISGPFSTILLDV